MPASKKEAKEFVKRWQKRLAAIPAGSNNEQQDTQKFWVDLLINVLGIPSNTIDSFVDFERKVRGRRIDVFVSDHNFLCEQKSWGIDLDKPEPRNGGMETPLQQAMWYARHLPYSERPRWVMTCNFGTFRLYDLDNERPEPTESQREEVERCAQAVLDARDAQEGATLADMYDPKNETFFPELMTAHKALDAAVEAAYGVDFGGDEEKIVAHLFNLYAKKVGEL